MYTVHSICHLNIYNYYDDDVDNFEDGGKSALVLIQADEYDDNVDEYNDEELVQWNQIRKR